MNYLETLNTEIRQYFSILSPEFPNWLTEYINTPTMLKQSGINFGCGADHTKFYSPRYIYSNLDHSIGVALIVWHFTQDKKATLAGLFHDISTPAFKHVVDIMNGDYIKQESIEELTSEFIKNDKEIMFLLDRDNIKIEEVDDYKLYPIADNDTPKLSADRLEYTLADGLVLEGFWNLEEIEKIYNNLTIVRNEDNIDELTFQDAEICENYIQKASIMWYAVTSNRDKLMMQFIADTLKKAIELKLITYNDLFNFSEDEIISKILQVNNDLSEKFKKFQQFTSVHNSEIPVLDKYCVSIDVKKRYVNPLVLVNNKAIRIIKYSSKTKKIIDGFLSHNEPKYAYIDIDI